jgi:hypothetical protein
MIVLDEKKLSFLFGEIAKGFVKGPWEIALFILLVSGIIAALVLLYQAQVRKAAVARALRAQEIFDRIARKRSFTPEEISLLERLSGYLKDPAAKHVLLERRSAFNGSVERMRKKENVPEALLNSLRGKLAHRDAGPSTVTRSSRDISKMQPIVLTRARGDREETFPGTALRAVPEGLVVSMAGENPFAAGTSVQVYLKSRTGILSFPTVVRKREGTLLTLSHGEQMKRIQRRKFFRQRTGLPVYIRAIRTGDAPTAPMRTSFVDLGGGGAALLNPQGTFDVGDRIELFFHFVKKKPQFRVSGEVIRTSEGGGATRGNEATRGGGKIHVLFDSMPEASRDRIIGFLLKKA